MINRTLIRIKALQILYSFYLSGGTKASVASNNLTMALDKSYHLYKLMVLVPYYVKVKAERRKEIELEKRSSDMELVKKLDIIIASPYVAILEADPDFIAECETLIPAREEFTDYFSNILSFLLREEEEDSIPLPAEDFDSHKEFWKRIYKRFIFDNDEWFAILQDSSIFWNDDIEIVMSFVLKVVNGMKEDTALSRLLRPQYNGNEEREFGTQLVSQAILNEEEYRALISKYFRNWDKERVAEIEYLILQLAITEAIHFPTIATSVTMNEYLNLVKYYSNPNNTNYINGILHQAIMDLKAEGRILGA